MENQLLEGIVLNYKKAPLNYYNGNFPKVLIKVLTVNISNKTKYTILLLYNFDCFIFSHNN